VRPRRRFGIEILSEPDLRRMRRAGLVVAAALAEMTAAAVAGVTTAEINAIGAAALARAGARSSFLGYEPGYGVPPYPAVACLSVNDAVVHGVPSATPLRDGDLLSVDFGAIVEGCHGDAARSVGVGQLAPAVERLNQATRAALWAGIGAARLGGVIGDITAAIEGCLRAQGRYAVVRDYTGHGIGHRMHQPPDIPNAGGARRGPTIEAGMCLAIEPMATLGSGRTAVLDDQWTVVTADHAVAAHWENTIAVTRHGVWVLTELDGGEAELNRLGVPFGPLAD
jgi:methionyl aminopeptidase